ncbi:uncharacterized protein F5147DRAFT_771481 [Suillus discolor]|uniref:Uncharacterized protein n=1 Tax=Suillus discolor TaxID=1912936 RepID=A0A9P7FAA0_9AGAM|nr:uncharacterized protein F5147DRAFT_771481 [Suillus discolor]KAG2111908.1 hypothetical protein F5147DRAFT_771481 [Suillus discolor]
MLTISVEWQHHAESAHIQDDIGFDFGDQMIDVPILEEPELTDAFPTFNHDDIKVEYHPNSGIMTSIHRFNTFECHPATTSIPPPDGHPWHPLKSCLEFKIAKIILEVGLNNKQTDRLIKLCH